MHSRLYMNAYEVYQNQGSEAINKQVAGRMKRSGNV